MERIKLYLIGTLTAITIVASGLTLTAPTAVAATRTSCGHTFCNPGASSCGYYYDHECALKPTVPHICDGWGPCGGT
jgi:hypothetical protein